MRNNSSARKRGRKVYKNEDIKAFQIMLIDKEGNQVGVVKRSDALRQATEDGLDLVQLSYDARKKVATAKIVDYGKYMYDKQQKEKQQKSQQKKKGQKVLKMGYNIGDHDLAIKLKKAQEFLEDGYTVKMMVVLRGREKAYKELVRGKFEHIEEKLSAHGKPQGIKEEQFGFGLIIFPKKQ